MEEGPVTRVEEIYRAESRRVLATLIRLLGDFDLAEEALQDAFSAAIRQWPAEGVPANPRAWLISTGRFKAVDALRRRSRFDDSVAELAHHLEASASAPDTPDPDEGLEDDRLRLIFTCCHPALAAEARTALTLREVCGLTTEEIARAFLAESAAIAQRIVRAKRKIRDARIPYQVPGPDELPGRLETVLQVVYLVFNEKYSASSGEALMRASYSEEAIRLGRLLYELLPNPEVAGLLALMLIQESRRDAGRRHHTARRPGSIVVESRSHRRGTATPHLEAPLRRGNHALTSFETGAGRGARSPHAEGVQKEGGITMKPISPCLWFDGRAEEAVQFYGAIFKDFRITATTRYGKAGQEIHHMKEGTVMAVSFELNGQPFMALNGGPLFKFTEAVSFQVHCDTQEELDHYWTRLGEGGDPKSQQCGWLKDKFGLSWQVAPSMLPELLHSDNPEVSHRVMQALLQMKKLDIAALRRAREL